MSTFTETVMQRSGEHLFYTALALLCAAALALPLGVVIGHFRRGRIVVVLATGAMRALPTLGVLILVVLIVGIGLAAPIIALVVIGIPPILAGAYAGIEAVDPATVDAARSLGMTEWQIVTKVEIPLAADIILGGIRSAMMQILATATIAAYVGLGGLGRFIIDGIAIRDYDQMLYGSLTVIVLALVLDSLLSVKRLTTPYGGSS